MPVLDIGFLRTEWVEPQCFLNTAIARPGIWFRLLACSETGKWKVEIGESLPLDSECCAYAPRTTIDVDSDCWVVKSEYLPEWLSYGHWCSLQQSEDGQYLVQLAQMCP